MKYLLKGFFCLIGFLLVLLFLVFDRIFKILCIVLYVLYNFSFKKSLLEMFQSYIIGVPFFLSFRVNSFIELFDFKNYEPKSFIAFMVCLVFNSDKTKINE